MQNNRQKLGLLLIALGLIIIILIIYFAFMRSEPADPGILEPAPITDGQFPPIAEDGTTTPADRPMTQVYDPSSEPAHQFDAEDLAKRAMLYAERLGSYSSQSDYGNFLDLKIYMTANMRAWVDRQVADLKSTHQAEAYYGIEAKALTSQTNSFNDEAGTAEVVVVTERRESQESIGGGESFRQSITLNFRKVNGEWLIDGAYWE